MVPLKTIGLADDQSNDLELLRNIVIGLGYTVVGIATYGQEAIELVAREKPQILLMDLHMPKVDGLSALKVIIPMQISAVIMLTGDTNITWVHEALKLGASGYIQKPYTSGQIAAALESGWYQAQFALAAQAESNALKEMLEVRKLAEKAKGILMEQQGFSEEEAHRCLQKMSQDQSIPLKEVCRSLIQVRMVLGQTGSRKAAMKPFGGR
jgi:response regulator NasT